MNFSSLLRVYSYPFHFPILNKYSEYARPKKCLENFRPKILEQLPTQFSTSKVRKLSTKVRKTLDPKVRREFDQEVLKTFSIQEVCL